MRGEVVRQWCLEKLSSEVGPTLKEGARGNQEGEL